MTNTILNKLNEIEREHGIQILYACESGSRGWQFASPDSDYDVRFIYIRPYDSYLSIFQPDDSLSFPINDELDIYGWDLRKVLQLMLKSNTTPFEWLQSPIIYREAVGFRQALWELSNHYFSRRSNTHHYLGIAKGALETITGDDEIKIKKLFYVLRPLLAAKWCVERNSIAPMTIDALMPLLPADMRAAITELIARKATAPESFMIHIDPALKQFIEAEFARCEGESTSYPKDFFDKKQLDNFFIQTITGKA